MCGENQTQLIIKNFCICPAQWWRGIDLGVEPGEKKNQGFIIVQVLGP